MAALKQTQTLCQHRRRTYTLVEALGTMMRKTNYMSMSDEQAHAELCSAESTLLQAALCILDGEDLAGFLRATIKIKSSYNIYKECSRILEKKPWESEMSRMHFQSGVRLGLATFSIMIAMLPPRLVTLLEFVGFSGDKEAGLAELQAGAREPGLRGVLCELTLLAYHLVVSHFAGATPDFDLCQRILETQLKVYPEGVWFLLFEGRLQLLRGRCALAAATYLRAADTPHLWRQLRHLCYWELMWANAMMMDWRGAAGFAGRLIEESSWSRTVYSYAKAALLLQLGEKGTPAERRQAADLLKAAPLYRQRIAGKSLPMEKWVSRRCERYAVQGGRLLLPAIELLCLWNMLPALSGDAAAVHSMLKQIEVTDERLDREENLWPSALEGDNRALLAYLRGCCLVVLGVPRLALHHLDHVVRLKEKIKEDSFLVPYALVEAAMCHHSLGEVDRAVNILQDTRKRYSNYSLESRLLFRIHSKLQIVRENPPTPGGSKDSPDFARPPSRQPGRAEHPQAVA
ncbi:tetratricopeptide repeat protein 39B-like isoform X2 [Battus philenor]